MLESVLVSLDGRNELAETIVKTVNKHFGTIEKNIKLDVIKKVQIENNGAIRNRWVVDTETPIFTQDKEYLLDFMPK